MRWHCAARYNGRKREFHLYASTFEQAKEDALHLATRHYVNASGKLGNEIWQNGVITLRDDFGKPVIIYEQAF